MDRLESELSALVDELRADAVVRDMTGCSPVELAKLERVCGFSLPRAYRLYLGTMGHSSDRLFTHDHYAVTFEHLIGLGDQLRDAMTEPGAPGAPAFVLPPKALVILGRLGEQFLFIVCDHPNDSPVFYVNSWDRVAKEAYPSILSWLRDVWA